jgi:hypothetical protein
MTLSELREKWENGGEVVLETVLGEGVWKSVYVILNFRDEYSLHRYFQQVLTLPSNPEWNVSVDVANSSLQRCLDEVTQDFQEVYPK